MIGSYAGPAAFTHRDRKQVGARDVQPSERQGVDAMDTDSVDNHTTADRPNSSVYERGQWADHILPLVLLGDQQLQEFASGIRSLTDAELEWVATIAQCEIDRRAFDAQHDPEFALALPLVEA
jgi:hypothetical protein